MQSSMSNNRSRLIMKQCHIRPIRRKLSKKTLQAIRQAIRQASSPGVETFSSFEEMEKSILNETSEKDV